MLLLISSRQVLLITGGNDGYPNYDPLDTTELLVPGSGSWRLAGLLPIPMVWMSVATVDNSILLTGTHSLFFGTLMFESRWR